MNVFHRFFFFLAASIVLLHNFMPHDHCAENNGVEHEEVASAEMDDLLDPFWLVFHEDVQGNLEHILPAVSSCQLLIDDVQLLSVSDFYLIAPVRELIVFSVEKRGFTPLVAHSEISRQRGPPSC